MSKTTVLFVCTHNASRSQMAEAWLRDLGGDAFEVCSAGTEPTEPHPLVVEAMGESEIVFSGQRAKSVDEFVQQPFDYLITLCDESNETCPFFPNATNRLHWSFPDPSLARGTHKERLAVFRQVRDGIRDRIQELIATMKKEKSNDQR